MNCLLTKNDPNHVIKDEIEISETVLQEQRVDAALEKDTAYAQVTSGSGRTSETRNDLTQHAEAKARKVAKWFPCPKCFMLFGNRKLAQCHMRKVHSDTHRRPETCPICSRTFKYKSVLFIHLNNHREKACPICNVVVPDSEALKNHVESLHIGKLEFVCPICFKLSIDSASHDDHVSSHNSRRHYECVDCSKHYASLVGLEKHRKTHAEVIKNKCPVQYKCSICSKVYASRRSIRVHMNTHTGTRPYKCDQCPQNYFCPQTLRKHRKKHLILAGQIMERKYKCSYCLKSYPSQQDLRSHINTHTGARPFKCNECPKDYASPQALLKHRQSHLPGYSRVKCSVCSKTLSNSRNLRFHMNTHVAARQYKCDECPTSFASPWALTQHRQRHLPGGGPVKCSICSKTLSNSQSLHFHMNIHTGTRPYKCDQCPNSFASPWGLTQHRQRHLSGGNRVMCSICSKTFSNSRNLRVHMKKHTGKCTYKSDQYPENHASSQALQNDCNPQVDTPQKIKEKKHKCSYCLKSYTSKHNLRTHINTHTGARPFKCDQCPKSFGSAWALTQHRQRHLSGGNRVKCSICSKIFFNSQSLRFHMNTHMGTRPYKCDQCPKSFASPCSLTQHRQRHLPGGSEIKCSICSKTLSDSKSLRFHMNTHTAVREYKCDLCPNSLASPWSLKKHRQSHSQGSKSEEKCSDASHKCNQCRKAYSSRWSLARHHRDNPSHGSNEHKCSTCSKAFISKRSLNNHMKTHLHAPPYKCGECPKEFSSTSGLGQHRRIHLTDGKHLHKCPVCYQTFTVKQSLVAHMNTHAGLRPHKCDQCPKDYATLRGLNVHLKKHVKKSDECKVDRPDKSLHDEGMVGEVDKVVNLHTALMKYKCKECDKEFISKRNLSFHLRLHV